MRIVRKQQVEQWMRDYPDAATSLEKWYRAAALAQWRSIIDVRKMFPSADGAIAGSGKPVTIFNIAGNKYRLIVAIHYNTQVVYTMMFLTHADYSKNKWKDVL